jgi:hypothetical protein
MPQTIGLQHFFVFFNATLLLITYVRMPIAML